MKWWHTGRPDSFDWRLGLVAAACIGVAVTLVVWGVVAVVEAMGAR